MLVRAIVLAIAVWIVSRFVLDGNPLAWPLAIFSAMALQSGASLLQSRDDLRINAVIVFVAIAMAMIWMALPRQEPADA